MRMYCCSLKIVFLCVRQACSPHYIFTYFIRNGLTGWESLGGIVLAITDMLRLLLQQCVIALSWGCPDRSCLQQVVKTIVA